MQRMLNCIVTWFEYCQFAHEIAMPGTRLPEQVDDSISFGKLKDVVNAIVASRDTLRQLVEVHTKQLTELTIIPIGCSREQELRWTQSIKDLRAALAAQDARKGA